jgi:NAD+ synthase (glutamine-hydrolysing)
MINKAKISVHQINTVTGDLDGNTNKIITCLEYDAINGVDISVFPETAISGYMCGSLWDRLDFVKKQNEKLKVIRDHYKSLKMKSVVIIGYISVNGVKRNGFPLLKNSVAIIDENGIRTYSKQILADSDHHEDRKYFVPGKETKVFKVNLPNVGEVTIGTPICEDSWMTDHMRDIPLEMVKMGAEILIIINQSYFYYGKQEKRNKLFSKIAKYNNVPVISVNAVGVGDILKNIVIFDGGSTIYNNDGRMLKELPRFEESTNNTFKISELEPIITPKYSKYEEITNAIIFEQKEFFRLCGLKKAQVHVSGGLDSSIVAALVYKAMGPENTVFISNPSFLNTKSKEYVVHLDEKLGTKTWWHPIQNIVNMIDTVDKEHMIVNGAPELSDTAKASIHAVLRSVLGLSDSHRFNSGIVATGNHTEIVLGWASFHDIGSIGAHAIIGDLTKVELYELSAYINDVLYGDEIIPYDLYNGQFKPAAELPDAMEDPIDYWVQSGICASLIRERKTKDDLVWEYLDHSLNTDYFPNMDEVYKYDEKGWIEQVEFAIRKMKFSVFKAAQGAPIVIMSPRSRGFSNRETLINKYNG